MVQEFHHGGSSWPTKEQTASAGPQTDPDNSESTHQMQALSSREFRAIELCNVRSSTALSPEKKKAPSFYVKSTLNWSPVAENAQSLTFVFGLILYRGRKSLELYV